MNKKLLPLAIGALLAASPLVAAHAGVKIGGYINVSADNLNDGNGHSGSFTSSNASNIVLSADTDLGNGLKAVFSAQTFIDMGSNNNPPGAGGPTLNTSGFTYNTFGNGNTYAGLAGAFGMVAAGRNDSPMKQLGRQLDLFGNQIGDSRNIIQGFAGNRFDLRPGHTIFYVSPNFAGFQGKAAYTTENAVLSNLKAHTSSVSGTYHMGPFFAGLAYETHSTNTYAGAGTFMGVASATTDENAWRLGGGVSMGQFKVVALYQREHNLNGASGVNLNSVWGLGAAFKFTSKDTVKAQYYRAGDVSGCAGLAVCSNTGAAMWAVGYQHAFTKHALVYADYARTNNNSNGTYGAFGGGHGNTTGAVAAGKDPHGVSVGMIYTF